MSPNLLKEAIADAKAVRDTALANARQAMNDAFNGKFAKTFSDGLIAYTTEEKEDGVIRYNYGADSDYFGIMEGIKREGLLVLDEDEEKRWVDTIKPDILANNIISETLYSKMAQDITDEIDKEIIDGLIKQCNDEKKKEIEEAMRLKKLKNKYYKWKSYMKQPPCPVDEEHIPTFEEWVKHEK